MIVHQSDLKSFHRCGEQHRRQLAGEQGKQLSATAFGSVLHHALHVLERERDLELAVRTFEHYWNPLNIDAITTPVDTWIMRHSHGSLLTRGIELLRRYWDLKQYDDDETLLALEIPFVVDLEGTWDVELDAPHQLAGTIDRLAVRKHSGKWRLCVDDWKTGRKPAYLPHNVQFTAYAYATTKPEFWRGNPEMHTEGFGPTAGKRLMEQYEGHLRRGFWIDLSGNSPKWLNAGDRFHQDYLRFLHAVDQYVRARQARIFPLAIDGSVCEHCPWREVCPEEVSGS